MKLNKSFASFKRVLRYLGRYRIFLWLSLALTAVNVVCSLYIPVLIGETVDAALAKGQVDFTLVARKTAIIAALAVCAALCGWLSNRCNNRMCFNTVRDIRSDVYRRISDLPVSYIDSHPHGGIVSLAVADTDQISDGLLMGLTQLFSGVLTILGTLVFMFRIHALVALVVVVVTPLSLLVAAFIAKRTFDMFRERSACRAEQVAFIQEMTEGQRVVRAFGAEERIRERFTRTNERLRASGLKATFFSSITNPSTRFVNSVVYAAVCLSGALLSVAGGFSVGNLVSFLSYANQYTKPFNEISGVVTELQNALACADRVLSFIEEAPSDSASDGANKLIQTDGTFRFDHVSFGYSPEKTVLNDLSFSVADGEHLAIVGPTGCGKTTLINLLMRFYDASAGAVLLGDTDITSLRRESVREHCGMVLQDTWLRHGTIRENIAIGKENATEEEIVRAAKAARAHGFISRLPDGYDTVISDEGGSLSEGQRQLLCIARVMLRKPDILILDEATSSIDVRTEQLVSKAFDDLMRGRTSLVVAHRLSTIEHADTILVLKDGVILERGTHKELLDKNGFYKELYLSQFRGNAI